MSESGSAGAHTGGQTGGPGAAGTPTGEDAPIGSFLTVLLEDALAANGMDAWPAEGFPGVLTGSVEGAFGQWSFFAQADEESLGVVVYSVFPTNTPEDRRRAVADFTARANYLLRYGSLEMDFSDGEVRVRTSARGGPEALEFNVIAELVRTNVEVSELFFPALHQVALQGADPAQAVANLLGQLRQG